MIDDVELPGRLRPAGQPRYLAALVLWSER